MRAARRDPLRRGLEHLEQLALVVLAMAAGATETDALARQRTGDEGGLAAVHHALAGVREVADDRGLLLAQLPSCQAPRNAAKCGSRAAAR